MTFALLTRERADFLVDRYTEHKSREPERLKDVAVDIEFVKRPMGVSSTDYGTWEDLLSLEAVMNRLSVERPV